MTMNNHIFPSMTSQGPGIATHLWGGGTYLPEYKHFTYIT